MIRIIVVVGVIFVALAALTLSMAPDVLALSIVGFMLIAVLLGFIFGMVPASSFSLGFKRGLESIEQALRVQSSSAWLALQQNEFPFHQRALDQLFGLYVAKYHQQTEEEIIPSDIEDFINEESLALRSWQSVVVQIPGTLTSLGLLGTFIGLVTGISNIGFSSVDAALSSIEVLLSGIRTAFFTSIVGVIFSILFNLVYKLIWNAMLRQMGMFTERFHMEVMPCQEELIRQKQDKQMQQVIARLDRLPKGRGFSMSASDTAAQAEVSAEQRLMPEILEGFSKGEFTFYLQPRCELGTRKIISGEALIRWNHGEMGVLTPGQFLPVVERNGYIARLDRYILESVCKTIRRWIDSGTRPIPISVNISKMDVLSMDVAGFFEEMIRKYKIPPRYLEIEIAQNALLQSQDIVRNLVTQLRQDGFRVIVDGYRGEMLTVNALKQNETDAIALDLRFVEGKPEVAIPEIFDSVKALNASIIAIGVENTEQLTILRRCGCKEGQGNYFYKPMPIEKFEDIMGREH